MGFIYKVTNTVNGKVYIGQTRNTISSRWTSHKCHAKCDNKLNSNLHRAIRKYGVDSFVVEEVEQCDNELLNEREIYWIQHYDSIKSGYNIAKGGLGYIHDAVPVAQFDMDGNYVQTFPSVNDIASSMNVRPQAIYNVCDGYSPSFGGYQWKYLPDAEKCGMKLKKLKVCPKKVMVHQYTMGGNYIASFESISSAMYQFGAKGTGGIRACCEGRNRYCHGYRWSYEKMDKLPPMRKDNGLRRVAKLDDNGNVIKVYEKIVDAAKEHNRSPCSIQAVCAGIHEKCAGYHWEYYE